MNELMDIIFLPLTYNHHHPITTLHIMQYSFANSQNSSTIIIVFIIQILIFNLALTPGSALEYTCKKYKL
jgi:hypothetical protein